MSSRPPPPPVTPPPRPRPTSLPDESPSFEPAAPAPSERGANATLFPERVPGRWEDPRLRLVLLAVSGVVGLVLVGALMINRTGTRPNRVPAPGEVLPRDSEGTQAACDAAVPPKARPRTYIRPPKRDLVRGTDYMALIYTSCGDFKVDLLETRAPRAVSNFVFLAREDFYDGLTFHQVVVDFIVQGGDPNGQNGDPPDGPGYKLKDELPDNNAIYTYGAVGMANTGKPNSSGSQFFVVVHDFEGARRGNPQPLRIRPRYTIFGRVLPDFFGSVETIARQPTRGGKDQIESVKPVFPIYIEDIQILRNT